MMFLATGMLHSGFKDAFSTDTVAINGLKAKTTKKKGRSATSIALTQRFTSAVSSINVNEVTALQIAFGTRLYSTEGCVDIFNKAYGVNIELSAKQKQAIAAISDVTNWLNTALINPSLPQIINQAADKIVLAFGGTPFVGTPV